ncbi:hypothetical protein [Flammeovirga agarivorans]|uniref:Uncharacterized protein n=1 Tax=Flammeovirga agarivorans TaxID=2726742 RepID=A0A7X8SIX0_9BACT|nr:hypothetical protein [Flammeovirga agarivorans]NLR91056.1 hypothetical protein [Flammeovirga agarivorans]
MNIWERFIRFFKKEDVNYWDGKFDENNVRHRFEELQTSYNLLHDEKELRERNSKPTNIIGNYAVFGHNPWDSTSEYTGNVSIQELDKNKFHIDWTVGFSDYYQKGTGQWIKNFFVVNFDYKDNQQTYKGVVIYKSIDDETLEGFWIEEGIFEVGFERLTLKNRLI